VTPRRHEYALVLSQDCDLDLDFKARRESVAPDKMISSVLFCEVTTAEQLRQSPGGMNSSIWGRVKTNKDERFLQRHLRSGCLSGRFMNTERLQIV